MADALVPSEQSGDPHPPGEQSPTPVPVPSQAGHWLDELSQQLAQLEQRQLRRVRRTITWHGSDDCRVDGQPVLNLAGNDYLHLARDPRLIATALEALQEAGTGSSASALITGRTDWHQRLEQALCRFENQPAAILFPSGYAANLGTLTALCRPGDTIYCDRLNHACLIDGCRLSQARLRLYRHEQLDKLRAELQHSPTGTGRRWIVTDSVFSMDGDLAPLPELCDLAEQYGARVMVDEAHGTGVYGVTGQGACEELQVLDRVAVRIGTLSKALGSQGGFVTGPEPLIDWLWNTARTQMFSTALTPGACAAAIAALRIVLEEPQRRDRLRELHRRLRERLGAAGIAIPIAAIGPIIPLLLGTAEAAVRVGTALQKAGYLVGIIRPPTVPEGTARLRISLHAGLSAEQIDQFAAAVIRAVHEADPD